MSLKLHWAATSPYVRKVMVAAHELGVADRLELLPTTPETVVTDVAAVNPLGQIPALVLEDGTCVFDSLVIVDYLDSLAGGGLIPRDGPMRWRTLTLHALGQGVIDAVNARTHEARRPPAERSPSLFTRKRAEVARALDALERSPPPADRIDIGMIAVAVGLGYVDRRMSEFAWRPERPALARWHEAFSARPSMRATEPPPL